MAAGVEGEFQGASRRAGPGPPQEPIRFGTGSRGRALAAIRPAEQRQTLENFTLQVTSPAERAFLSGTVPSDQPWVWNSRIGPAQLSGCGRQNPPATGAYLA